MLESFVGGVGTRLDHMWLNIFKEILNPKAPKSDEETFAYFHLCLGSSIWF